MLIFTLNFGGAQGGRWQLAPLITLLPFLLTSGLPLLQSLLSLLFGIGGWGTSTVFVYDPSTQTWRRQGSASSDGAAATAAAEDDSQSGAAFVSSVLVAFTSMIVTAALTVLFMKFVVAARREGFRAGLRRVFLEGFGGGWAQQRGAGQPGAARAPAQTRAQRIERVANLMQGLPVEVYRSRQELERMSVAELKQVLKKRGVACEQCLEKRELVEQAAEGGNSSAASCSICCEDYESGDVLRVLPCGHRYHLECVDRWFLSSTDYSRPPACPMCNKELDGSGSGSATRS